LSGFYFHHTFFSLSIHVSSNILET
jgi:hypothetical protein